MFDLGTDFASSTLEISAAVFSGFVPYITLIVGVLLAVLAVTFLVRAFHR